MDNKKYYQFVDELNALREGSWFGLRFHSSTEAEFQAEHTLWYRQTVKQASFMAAMFLLMGLLIEAGWDLEVHPLCQWGRGVAVATVVLSGLYVSRSRHSTFHSGLLLMNGLLCTLVILSFAFLCPPPIKQIYYSAVFFVEVFVFAYMRLAFNMSLLCGAIIFIISTAVLTFDPVSGSERVMIEFLMTAGTVLSLVVCHRLEMHERENFIQKRLIAIERDQLRNLNLKLQDRLACDGVTHLANRRTFEDLLLEVLERKQKSKLALAIVVIDGFKNINETCGEDMGDDLLRSVARSLSATLAGGGEAAARVGGGKFAAIWFCDRQQDIDKRLERLQTLIYSARVLKDPRLQGQPVQLRFGAWAPPGTDALDSRQFLDAAIERCVRKVQEKSVSA